MKKHYLYLFALLFTTISFSQGIIIVDDYETAPVYTSAGAGDYFDSSTQYFGTTNDTDADVELGYSDITFFGARQLKNATESISYSGAGFDLTSFPTVQLVVGIAEDKGPGGTEDWDTGDAVHIQYRLGGVDPWIDLVSIVASGASDSAPQIDANNDGTGDGLFITSDIQDFEFEITTSGADQIDLRLNFEGLSEEEEDIVFEYIAVVHDLNLFPEITITAPNEDGSSIFSNGIGSVDVVYTVSGNAESVEIIVNDGSPITGSITGGTESIFVGNDTSYEVEVIAYLEGVNVDDTDVYFEVGAPLSIGKDEIENFTVYPNPVNNGEFSISTGINSLKTVQLFNVIGKSVLSKQVQNNETIDISNLNTGVYILKVKEGDKMATRKLVIN
jgi:hypothetical protein